MLKIRFSSFTKQQIAKGAAMLFLSLMAISTNAQSLFSKPYKYRNSGSYEKGKSILSLGYGLDQMGAFKEEHYVTNRALGPFMAQVEQGVLDELGVAFRIEAGFSSGAFLQDQFNITSLGVGANITYHFNKFIPVEALDVYVGGGVAVRYNTLAFEKNVRAGLEEVKVNPVAFIGARYYILPNVGIFAQGGYDGFSTVQLGINMAF